MSPRVRAICPTCSPGPNNGSTTTHYFNSFISRQSYHILAYVRTRLPPSNPCATHVIMTPLYVLLCNLCFQITVFSLPKQCIYSSRIIIIFHCFQPHPPSSLHPHVILLCFCFFVDNYKITIVYHPQI